MKPTCIIIAGPMVSGKTTAARTLVKKFKNTLHHPEINQYTVAGSSHPGGAFVDKKLEEKIIKADLSRLRKIILNKRNLIHLIETDICHSVYSKIFGEEERAKEIDKEYKKLHQKASVGVFFIDTNPQISWARRRGYYLRKTMVEVKKRGLKGVEAKKIREKMMNKFKKRIFALYPFWLEMFESLPYPKIKIPNNGKSLEAFEKKVIGSYLKLTRMMRIEFQRY